MKKEEAGVGADVGRAKLTKQADRDDGGGGRER
jgi:hypothetical protein